MLNKVNHALLHNALLESVFFIVMLVDGHVRSIVYKLVQYDA